MLTFARRRAALVLWLAGALGLAGVLLVSRVKFDANILRLLPQGSPTVRNLEKFLRDFGSLDHLYIVFESHDVIGEHAELVDAYVDGLRQSSEIESVDAQLFEPGKDWSYLADRELLLLGLEGASDALKRFERGRLDGEIANARSLLSVPSPQIKALVQQDPLDLLTLLRDRMARQKGIGPSDVGQDGYVSRDGHSRLVIVKPRGAPFDTDFCRALFRRLAIVEAAARHSTDTGEPPSAAVHIQTAGSYRVSLESEELIRRETIVNAVGSLLLLLLVVFILFRTPWVMVYGLVPLTLAAVLALGISGLAHDSLSPATSGSASMLFGLGIDGIVLLYLRYVEERQAGRSADDATRRMAGTAVSVVLAQITTAATFLALVWVDFPSLQDLGTLVGVGILICCALTLILLPALLSYRRERQTVRALTAARLGQFVTRAATPIMWVGIATTVALGAASSHLRLDLGIERLQAQTRGAAFERELGDRFSLPRDVLLVLNDSENVEPLLDADARLAQALAARDPLVAVSGIGLILPPASIQAGVSQLIVRSALVTPVVDREIRAAAERVGFRSDAFEPFLRRVPTLLNPDERLTYDGLIGHGLDSIVSRFVVRDNGRYEAVTYLYPPSGADTDALAALVRDVDPHLRLTGLPVVNHELAQRFLPQFLTAMAIGTGAVALLIYVVFRTVRHTLLALLPTAVGFVWSAGVLALLRVELDLFSLFAAVTFVGISVDYSIYVLYRYAKEAPRDMGEVLTRTGAAIMIACLTAIIGFGTLINSSYGPLRGFGIVSVVTLACCLVASLVFMPAVVIQTEARQRRRLD